MFYLDTYIAHRGFHNEVAPENSLAAFSRSIEAGFAIELDVRLTKDNEVIVFHDDSLKRMTSAGGLVNQYILTSLKSLKLHGSSERIPTLKEVLTLVDGRVPLIIELKNNSKDKILEEKTMDLLSDYSGEYTIQSFNPFSLQWIRENHPNVIIGLLTTYDFGKESIESLKKALVRYMPMLPLIRPEYIGLNYKSYSPLQLGIIKNLTNSKIIYWTVDNESDFKRVHKNCSNLIFEGFDPRDSIN